MLTPRQELLLRKVVEGYSTTGLPVGSKALAADPDVSCGPSTIRNELAVLEELGLLAHPHTSAGRAPTDSGHRYYVDRLLLGGPLALAATKELLRRVPTMSRDDAFEWTAQLSASLFASDEAREGMAAFVERRPPAWAPPPEGADLVSDESRRP